MPKPACVKCQRFYRPLRNGVRVMEQKPEHEAKPGTEDAEHWHPYKVWVADAWKCEGCNHILVSGYGYSPLWLDYDKASQPDVQYTINDC